MKYQSTAVIVLLYVVFFAIGFGSSLFGPLVPSLREDLGINYSLTGVLFGAISIGSLIVLIASGWLIHKAGAKNVLWIGAVVYAASSFLVAFASNTWIVFIANALSGAGMSLLDVGASTVLLQTQQDRKGKALGYLHGFFGVGAVVGPIFVFFLKPLVPTWRWGFGLFAVFLLALVVYVAFVELPRIRGTVRVEKNKTVYRSFSLWLVSLCLFLYIGVEWGIGTWLPSYWSALGQRAVLDPSIALSLFWFTFALGRFVVGKWADAWGFRAFVLASVVVTMLVTIVWIAFADPLVAAISVFLLGFVIAGQYPTFVAMVSHRFPNSSGYVTSFLSFFAALGALAWPIAGGLFNDYAGILALPWAQAGLTATLLALTVAAFVVDRRKAETRTSSADETTVDPPSNASL